MLPLNVGWLDSGIIQGTGTDKVPQNGTTAPSNVLKIMRSKVEEQVEPLNSHEVGKKAKKPARKAAPAPNAKVQVTGEDKAAKEKTVKEVKAKAVKEVKAKLIKEAKMKETTTKTAKAKAVKEAKADLAKEKRVKNEPTEPKIKEPKARKTVGTTRKRNSSCRSA
ncbi:hypothetical protein L208DRAFT_500427 [Tricholoma matsutake]|nr:hypothetical protein L208DRAFT_500427 [Tricholoma matsutake 945]